MLPAFSKYQPTNWPTGINMKVSKQKIGTITTTAAARITRENHSWASVGTLQRCISEVAPTKAGSSVMRSRSPIQGSLTSSVSASKGASRGRRYTLRRKREKPPPRKKQTARCGLVALPEPYRFCTGVGRGLAAAATMRVERYFEAGEGAKAV